MRKNNLITITLLVLFASAADAQTAPPTGTAAKPSATAKPKAAPKKVNIDFENDVITGSYDVPDAQFLNSRKLIKYKELFNKRTNFIEEIEANKGLFNEYQK